MLHLTRQQQLVLSLILFLLLTGWAVKTWRAAHPPPQALPGRYNDCMHELDFREALHKILKRDPRFHRDAYLFVREALDYTQKMVTKANKEQVRHVTGQELLDGIREYALQVYGPMTHLVLAEWGVHSCQDFGEIVFNMVEASLLAKTEKDTLADFKEGYTFEQAFRQPFRPTNSSSPQAQPNSSQP